MKNNNKCILEGCNKERICAKMYCSNEHKLINESKYSGETIEEWKARRKILIAKREAKKVELNNK